MAFGLNGLLNRDGSEVLTDDENRELQAFLSQHQDAGDLLPCSHGLRKLRWTRQGKGKRSGTRVIYYWLKSKSIILMVFLFRKNERSDLSKDQLKALRTLAMRELR